MTEQFATVADFREKYREYYLGLFQIYFLLDGNDQTLPLQTILDRINKDIEDMGSEGDTSHRLHLRSVVEDCIDRHRKAMSVDSFLVQ